MSVPASQNGVSKNMETTLDGQLEINLGSSENTIAPMESGVPYFREVGVEHDVINGNDFECAFIEIEFLK